ncbi:2-C-methyl-D-erythritol 2,4-cyclodiphosphate synthase [Ferroacidibacillus organovorans]|uniref:2-C-methyl-D-erythritol 2,4-cyclodiphosphate synthase n=1 Tax=Ferroacidibacillus organovorans TaxID=1765683 RepID=A0A162SA76_9BACL|nr:2-C-methyl-D-erythritol 2,4-cyclodiphosphate synthase [Ferroacidibacillus organovorans]KYP79651.1 2-C-methyl-D-erythritol 2,4-cyclodiphosphate synthase [Ferroacidibacillus organovorans]OAG94781.1 2-C-methyl-D-erythritol 2,4-cyclodiphosphate synthase [Ferroacidibacillus organovorans]OPG14907.1 2-C-methyl-D-erythritol 2,4-cyclodiphosphate synthase [Ferroacidibacillus organovorans]
MRVGLGFDVHRFQEGRPLVLAGVAIPSPIGLLGHSDADVILHALMDALLGALALGDIGDHFPDTDEQYRGISSVQLLSRVMDLITARDYVVSNVDVMVMAEAPKLSPYKKEMIQKMAQTLQVSDDQVSLKATTMEGMGFVGRREGIAAQAMVSLVRCTENV